MLVTETILLKAAEWMGYGNDISRVKVRYLETGIEGPGFYGWDREYEDEGYMFFLSKEQALLEQETDKA